MDNLSVPDSLCVSVGEISECMSGEILIGALLLECGLYFFFFVFGMKIVDWLRKTIGGEKRVREKV